MIEKDYICIICPLSCDLHLTDDNGELTVTGNTCKRGEMYAKSEYTNPVRMVTTTVTLENGLCPLLPVISSDMVPKSKFRECFDLIYNTKVVAPIKEGDVVIPDILGTGVDIVSAKSVVSKMS
ncbi:DUF1667 domain-containing protein [Chakrabartyella piscis]|uniref:DUF1667 domain-containing protein n=1 Tax=Chakrabartyella piscis TaxID=2918914 RepID=UPI002958D6E6|nr:DUF1667 domain-containing protein [Chakrabartyella piscis]